MCWPRIRKQQEKGGLPDVYFKHRQPEEPIKRDSPMRPLTATRSGGSRWLNAVVQALTPNTSRFTSRFKSVSPAIRSTPQFCSLHLSERDLNIHGVAILHLLVCV